MTIILRGSPTKIPLEILTDCGTVFRTFRILKSILQNPCVCLHTPIEQSIVDLWVNYEAPHFSEQP